MTLHTCTTGLTEVRSSLWITWNTDEIERIWLIAPSTCLVMHTSFSISSLENVSQTRLSVLMECLYHSI